MAISLSVAAFAYDEVCRDSSPLAARRDCGSATFCLRRVIVPAYNNSTGRLNRVRKQHRVCVRTPVEVSSQAAELSRRNDESRGTLTPCVEFQGVSGCEWLLIAANHPACDLGLADSDNHFGAVVRRYRLASRRLFEVLVPSVGDEV